MLSGVVDELLSLGIGLNCESCSMEGMNAYLDLNSFLTLWLVAVS